MDFKNAGNIVIHEIKGIKILVVVSDTDLFTWDVADEATYWEQWLV